jgi:hypothetical protein
VKYAVIDEHRIEFSVKALCLALEVSRSRYYAVKTAAPSLRSREDLAAVWCASFTVRETL